MLRFLKTSAFLFMVVCGGAAWAQAPGTGCVAARNGAMVCPQPDAQCRPNRDGNIICSTPGGGIESDRYGELVCGPGSCVKDQRGDVFCSSAPRGAAAIDRYGSATCADNCVAAKNSMCVIPKATR